MLSVNTVKPFCVAESSLRVQHKFFSHYSSSPSLKFLLNNLRKNFNCTFTKKFYTNFESLKFSTGFKEHSSKILKSCTKQCVFVFGHRMRRSQQMFSLYKKLWSDFNLIYFLQKFNISALKRNKFLTAASIASGFLWEKERIPEDELIRLEDEIGFAKNLYENKDNPEKNNKNSSEDLCDCDRCKHLHNEDDWELFFSNLHMKIWRKEHEKYKGQGLYVYKVYGKWNDVTANDFFQVQIDCKYRKEWDQNSVQLYVVDSDRKTTSDVLYWEFLFPKMFYNRDYVCNRRYKIDDEKKLMTIVSESVDHPSCPEKPPIHRVKEYWSHIVIKPKEDFDKPGLEFTITYFDNPGLNIPTYISLFYTITGMPEYLEKQKDAALNLAKHRAEYHRLKEKEKEKEMQQSPPSSYPQQQSEKRFLIL